MGFQLAADEDSNNSPGNEVQEEEYGLVEDGDEIVGIDMEEAVSSPENEERMANNGSDGTDEVDENAQPLGQAYKLAGKDANNGAENFYYGAQGTFSGKQIENQIYGAQDGHLGLSA